MSKATQESKAEAKREAYRDLVFRMSGLHGWPFEDLGKTALVDTLIRETPNVEHAARVIEHILAMRNDCPTPLELMNLCRTLPVDPRELPDGCARCGGWEWAFVDVLVDGETRQAVERCSCARGRRLAELDAARKAGR